MTAELAAPAEQPATTVVASEVISEVASEPSEAGKAVDAATPVEDDVVGEAPSDVSRTDCTSFGRGILYCVSPTSGSSRSLFLWYESTHNFWIHVTTSSLCSCLSRSCEASSCRLIIGPWSRLPKLFPRWPQTNEFPNMNFVHMGETLPRKPRFHFPNRSKCEAQLAAPFYRRLDLKFNKRSRQHG